MFFLIGSHDSLDGTVFGIIIDALLQTAIHLLCNPVKIISQVAELTLTNSNFIPFPSKKGYEIAWL